MKNTTIPITATIVFSAAVAVLNVVQNEPSRLHANGFQTLGACWSKEEDPDRKEKCLAEGWHGKADSDGNRQDPNTLTRGEEAWKCKTPVPNEKEKEVNEGKLSRSQSEVNCAIAELWRVQVRGGQKRWEKVTDENQLKNATNCGQRIEIKLSQFPCKMP
jgi:hypothetical protein